VAGSSTHSRAWTPSASILDLVSCLLRRAEAPTKYLALIGLSLRVLVGLYQRVRYASLRWNQPPTPLHGPYFQEYKAAKILAHFHSVGFDERNPLVLFEIAQIRRSLTMEQRINRRVSFATLFATPGNRKRMRIVLCLALFSQWR
jgi:hypothetical protein